jgi:hypothetical protein
MGDVTTDPENALEHFLTWCTENSSEMEALGFVGASVHHTY